MKKLIITAAFSVLGFSVFATDVTKDENAPKQQKKEVKAEKNVSKLPDYNCATGFATAEGNCFNTTATVTYCCTCTRAMASYFAFNVAINAAQDYANYLDDVSGC